MSPEEANQVVYPDDRVLLAERARQRQQGQDVPSCYEFRLIRKDGAVRWVECFNVRTLYRGSPAVQMTYIDITERKEAEEALRENRALLQGVMDYAPMTLYIKDIQGRYVQISQQAASSLGYTREQFLGKTDSDLFPDGIHDAWSTTDEQILTTGEALKFEVNVPLANGTHSFIAIKFPIFNEHGDIRAIGGAATDITDRKLAEEALRASEQFVRQVIDSTPAFIFARDHDGRFTLVNQTMADVYGTTVEALLGKTDADMHLDAQELERIRQEDRQVIDTGTELVIPERHIKDAHGRNRYFSVVKRLLTLPDDTADQVLVVGADITARKEAEEALRESEERIRQISDNLPNGIIYQLRQASDGTCTFSYMSDTVKHLTGYTAEQVIANAALVLDSHHPDDQESYLAAVTESVRTLKPLECELRQYVADGSLRWRQFYATPRCEPDGTIIWDGICIDITERKQLEHQLDQANMLLQEQAIRDPLTGLHNRRYLDETLPRELQRAERAGQPVGIIMLDIDHFKRFNDTYGHDAGDTVLRAVGAFLKEHTRGADIACRYGGEEFTLVLPGASLADTQQRAEELRAGIQTLAVQHGEQPLAQVTISLGVAVFPAHGTTAESLIRAADQALYQAKRNGRNRIEVVTILHSEA